MLKNIFLFLDSLFSGVFKGVRDNDMFALQSLVTYQHYENQAAPKIKALVYGANHNFFNQELKKDDGSGLAVFQK